MFQRIENKGDFNSVEYVSDNLAHQDNHKCSHVFKRVEDKVECTHCGVGYVDLNRSFPIDELNEFFSDPKTQKYLADNPV